MGGWNSRRAVLWSFTLARIFLVPVFLGTALYLQELAREARPTAEVRSILVALLALVALTDAADGWLARRHGLASQAGAIWDALSDKIAQIAFLAFFTFGRSSAFTAVPIWLFAVVLARDSILSVGWLVLRLLRGPYEVVHRAHGRAALVAVFSVLFWATMGLPPDGLQVLAVAAALMVIASTLVYVTDASRRGPRGGLR
jgi:phosphatidylglycerophosphate synthase